MIRSLFLLIAYVALVGLGLAAPFVFTLGYIWVDLFTPQSIAYFFLNQFPCALVMGVAALGSYILVDRRSPPRLPLSCVLTLALAIWCTVTLLWAVVPDPAWDKWSWAFKTVVFSAFIPFVIRSRIQIEAFLLVYVFSLAGNLVPYGIKTAISGSGYGRNLGLVAGNSGLSEGALLATAAVSVIPIAIYAARHSLLLPKHPLTKALMLLVVVVAVFTTVGTYERTGLVGLAVFGVAFFIKSKRKILTACFGIALALGFAYHSSSAWDKRMQTIGAYDEENSALGRLLVWQWTLNYTLDHPLGGGFEAYRIDRIEFPDNNKTAFGIAFHSMYFEMLGEQGWIGLTLYLAIIAISFVQLWRVERYARRIPDLAWCADLASSLLVMLAVLVTCGAFIAVAYRGMNFYTFAISTSLSEYVRRVQQAGRTTGRDLRWRSPGGAPALPASLRPALSPPTRSY